MTSIIQEKWWYPWDGGPLNNQSHIHLISRGYLLMNPIPIERATQRARGVGSQRAGAFQNLSYVNYWSQMHHGFEWHVMPCA